MKIKIISFLILLFIFSSCSRTKKEKIEKERIPEVVIPSQVEEKIKEEKEVVSEQKMVEKEVKEEIPSEKIYEQETEKLEEKIALLPKEKKSPSLEEKVKKEIISPLYFEKWNGECLIYNVKWNSMNFGKVLLVFKEEKNSYGRVYHILGITIPEGILSKFGYGYNRADSFIDVKTGKPYYFYLYTKTGRTEKITEIFFDWKNRKYKTMSKKFRSGNLYSTKNEMINFDKEIFDCLSVLYFIRDSQIFDLEEKEIQIALSEIWYLKIGFKGKDERDFPGFGKKEVFIIEPKARTKKENFDKGKMNIYLTTDDSKLPIYFEGNIPAGKAIMYLESVEKIEPSLILDRDKIWNLLKNK